MCFAMILLFMCVRRVACLLVWNLVYFWWVLCIVVWIGWWFFVWFCLFLCVEVIVLLCCFVYFNVSVRLYGFDFDCLCYLLACVCFWWLLAWWICVVYCLYGCFRLDLPVDWVWIVLDSFGVLGCICWVFVVLCYVVCFDCWVFCFVLFRFGYVLCLR